MNAPSRIDKRGFVFTPRLKAERAFGNYEKRRLVCLEVSISPRRLVLGNMPIPHTTRRVLPVFLAGLNRSGGFIAVVSLGGLLCGAMEEGENDDDVRGRRRARGGHLAPQLYHV